jgi:hypothetical protein
MNRNTLALSLALAGSLAASRASAKIIVEEVDKKPFEPSVTVIARHWGFNSEAEKKVYLEWLKDRAEHRYKTKEAFKAAVKEAAASGGAQQQGGGANKLTGTKHSWTFSQVALKDVKNLPDPRALQAAVVAYIRAVTGGQDARRPEIGALDGADKFKVIGNPKVEGQKVVATVLNAGQGWSKTHDFDSVDAAIEFFRETGAVNRGHEVLINAHMKEGSDAVHELMHSYQGSDGRWDWYFNEGMTDYFAIDFGATQAGRGFKYQPGRTYGQAVEVVTKIVAIVGKDKIAKMYFGDTDPGLFKNVAKELSMILKQQQMAKDNPGVYTLQLEPGPMANKYKKLNLLGGKNPPPMFSDKEITDAANALKKKLEQLKL